MSGQVGRPRVCHTRIVFYDYYIRGITSLSDHSGKSDGGGGLYIKGTVFGSTGRSFSLGSALAHRPALHLSSVLTSDHQPAFPLGSGCQPAFPAASVHIPDRRPAFPLASVQRTTSHLAGCPGTHSVTPFASG